MSRVSLRSWGLPGPYDHVLVSPDRYAPASLPRALAGFSGSVLAIGNGRSYGDVGLNIGAGAILCRDWDRIVSFDPQSGEVIVESGVTLDRLITVFMAQGWFPAVVPGTRFVTVGGAIANDVHGKNHHCQGSFGDHVLWLDLWRSDGSLLRCSRDTNAELFAATLGGLGMTGVVVRACIRLRRIDSGMVRVRTTRFHDIDGFLALNALAEVRHEYTVAWLDCLSHGGRLGRGLFYAGDHAPADEAVQPNWPQPPRARTMPLTPPFSLVNPLSLAAFNQMYWMRAREGDSVQAVYPYFFPLDGLLSWNRMYGRAGFYQYQCVLPHASGREGILAILRAIASAGQGSFLAVLKTFGNRAAPGLLSFARPGITLALDFPNRGESTRTLFSSLNAIVAEHAGALYPAKDALMPASLFQSAYPRWREVEQWRDPRMNSSFWRRVSAAEQA